MIKLHSCAETAGIKLWNFSIDGTDWSVWALNFVVLPEQLSRFLTIS